MTMADEVLSEAERWIGTPYRHGASRRGVSCDCLGLVRGVWRSLYGCEPEAPAVYAPDWAEVSTGDPMLEAASRHMIRRGSGAKARRPCRVSLAGRRCSQASGHHGA